MKGAKRQRKLKDSRGTTFYPDQVEDYWALLLEKAFAKFVGGYMNLEGGCPRWAVTYLSGQGSQDEDVRPGLEANAGRSASRDPGIRRYYNS